VWVNQNYANWLHRPVEQIIGRHILDVVGKDAFKILRPRFEQVLSGEEVAYRDNVSYDGIGSRYVSAAYRPTLNSAGEPDGWFALVQDITDQTKEEGPARAGQRTQ
jgi:PAS domain S-box-containing protein